MACYTAMFKSSTKMVKNLQANVFTIRKTVQVKLSIKTAPFLMGILKTILQMDLEKLSVELSHMRETLLME